MMTSQFTQYYTDNLTAMHNFARRLTRNESMAEELVQEAMIKAFRGFHTFEEGSSFKSWAFTIVKNTFITKYNKRKKRGVVNAPIEDFTFALESTHTVDNNAISKIQVKEIKSCINKLSRKSREPFKLHVAGYQYNEIADALDIPIGTVKSRINFARTKLKSILIEEQLVAA